MLGQRQLSIASLLIDCSRSFGEETTEEWLYQIVVPRIALRVQNDRVFGDRKEMYIT